VKRHVAGLAILIAGRDSVSDDAQRKPFRVPGEGILRRSENIALDGRGETLAPVDVENAVEQRFVIRVNPQPQRLVVKLESKRRQRGCVDQGDAFHLGAPRIVRGRRIVEAQGKNPIAGDATTRKNAQQSALFAREAFDRITKQCGNTAHGDAADFNSSRSLIRSSRSSWRPMRAACFVAVARWSAAVAASFRTRAARASASCA